MLHSLLTLFKSALPVLLIGLAISSSPLYAKSQTITGVVVDSESRKKLDDVSLQLLESGQLKQELTINAAQPFSLDYDFIENTAYQLVFSKADYFNQTIDLSNALGSGKMPKQMTIAMNGDESAFIFWGKSLNRETNQPIANTLITLTNRMTGERLNLNSDMEGNYSLNIVTGYEYDVTFESPVHLKRFGNINFCRDTLEKDEKYCFSGFNNISLNENGGVSGAAVLMDKIELGKKFKVDNIYYDYNKATIRPAALPNLRKVLYILNDNPQITIELGSHADSRGSDSYNLELSERRAAAAVDYVIKEGISASRIRSRGYGETVLVNDCGNESRCSDAEHAKNRRTEFIIVGIDESYFKQ